MMQKDMSFQNTIRYNKSGPARYCNRIGVWDEIECLLAPFGKKCVVSGGVRARASVQNKLFPQLEKAGIQYAVNAFAGESSENNVHKLLHICEEFSPDYLIGVGGGKSLDTAKYAAALYGCPIITVPTIAATCAASSNQIIVYSDSGEYLENVYPKTNPELVLVDPDVILHAPINYYISGIYDALAKWYEGRASLPGSENADIFDQMALALARMLKESVYAEAAVAVESVRKGELTREFIDICNINLYTASTVQALGIKAVRNGIAHSVNNGLSLVEGVHDVDHGMKVAYGIAVQLIVLDSPREELRELFGLYDSMGFDPSFQGMHLRFTEENVGAVAKKATDDVLMRAKPFDVISREMLGSAMKELEELRS
ncbi:iron-containing alcohol dehydrogenase family protein [Clostridium sp. KNHs216]|uniref:iron-containing alcohol dehydrogenase family protein n=1 Tax=Clostridium sp. KNHs216 TaxID=1550235 RepID=UPI00114D72F9|nr:iron-containing alcohol dehydrogenase family protein [Clostridium sp. KNHs216]